VPEVPIKDLEETEQETESPVVETVCLPANANKLRCGMPVGSIYKS